MDTRSLATPAEEGDARSPATLTLPAITMRSALRWTTLTPPAVPPVPHLEVAITPADPGAPANTARRGVAASIRSRHPSR